MTFSIDVKRNWYLTNNRQGNCKPVLTASCVEMGINPNETCPGSLVNYNLPPEHRGLGRAYLNLEIVGKGGRRLVKCKFKI